MNAVERRKVWLVSSWLISAIVHFSLTAVVAVVLRPAGQGESSTNTLLVSMAAAEPAEMELATFTAGPPVAVEIGEADFLSPDLAEQTGEVGFEVSLAEVELNAVPHVELIPRVDAEVPAPLPASFNRRAELPNAETPPAAKAEFFGTVARGDRFVYLLDMSGSMNATPDEHKQTRFGRARNELIRSLDQLNDRQGFCVALFSDKTRPMFDDRDLLKHFMRATPQNKERIKEWLMTINPDGNTDPNEALAKTIELSPSAIFLLSDGDFNIEKKNNAGLMFRKAGGDRNEIIDHSDEQRIPVHTIAFEDGAGAKNMQDLSKRTGGQYRFVPAPGKPVPKQAQAAEVRVPQPLPVPPTAEQLSARLLAVGKAHESLGRTVQACECYRKLLAQYPDSPAAKEASERVARLEKVLNR